MDLDAILNDLESSSSPRGVAAAPSAKSSESGPQRTTTSTALKPVVVTTIAAPTSDEMHSLLKSKIERDYSGLLNEGDAPMRTAGFKQLTETFNEIDLDGNTAVEYKVSTNTSPYQGSPAILTLKGFNENGDLVKIIRPDKYVNAFYTHSSGVSVQPWYRENTDDTLSLAFFPTLVGLHAIKLTMLGLDLFETSINVNPAGEESRWVTRYEQPQANKKWIIDVVRVDGSKPHQKFAFEVESQGNIEALAIEDVGGQYRVTCMPTTSGLVKISVRLQGNYINGSPIELAVPGEVTQAPAVITPSRGQTVVDKPHFHKPANAVPVKIAQPAQPVKTTTVTVQHTTVQPIKAQSVTAKSAGGKDASAALADLLADLESK